MVMTIVDYLARAPHGWGIRGFFKTGRLSSNEKKRYDHITTYVDLLKDLHTGFRLVEERRTDLLKFVKPLYDGMVEEDPGKLIKGNIDFLRYMYHHEKLPSIRDTVGGITELQGERWLEAHIDLAVERKFAKHIDSVTKYMRLAQTFVKSCQKYDITKEQQDIFIEVALSEQYASELMVLVHNQKGVDELIRKLSTIKTDFSGDKIKRSFDTFILERALEKTLLKFAGLVKEKCDTLEGVNIQEKADVIKNIHKKIIYYFELLTLKEGLEILVNKEDELNGKLKAIVNATIQAGETTFDVVGLCNTTFGIDISSRDSSDSEDATAPESHVFGSLNAHDKSVWVKMEERMGITFLGEARVAYIASALKINLDGKSISDFIKDQTNDAQDRVLLKFLSKHANDSWFFPMLFDSGEDLKLLERDDSKTIVQHYYDMLKSVFEAEEAQLGSAFAKLYKSLKDLKNPSLDPREEDPVVLKIFIESLYEFRTDKIISPKLKELVEIEVSAKVLTEMGVGVEIASPGMELGYILGLVPHEVRVCAVLTELGIGIDIVKSHPELWKVPKSDGERMSERFLLHMMQIARPDWIQSTKFKENVTDFLVELNQFFSLAKVTADVNKRFGALLMKSAWLFEEDGISPGAMALFGSMSKMFPHNETIREIKLFSEFFKVFIEQGNVDVENRVSHFFQEAFRGHIYVVEALSSKFSSYIEKSVKLWLNPKRSGTTMQYRMKLIDIVLRTKYIVSGILLSKIEEKCNTQGVKFQSIKENIEQLIKSILSFIESISATKALNVLLSEDIKAKLKIIVDNVLDEQKVFSQIDLNKEVSEQLDTIKGEDNGDITPLNMHLHNSLELEIGFGALFSEKLTEIELFSPVLSVMKSLGLVLHSIKEMKDQDLKRMDNTDANKVFLKFLLENMGSSWLDTFLSGELKDQVFSKLDELLKADEGSKITAFAALYKIIKDSIIFIPFLKTLYSFRLSKEVASTLKELSDIKLTGELLTSMGITDTTVQQDEMLFNRILDWNRKIVNICYIISNLENFPKTIMEAEKIQDGNIVSMKDLLSTALDIEYRVFFGFLQNCNLKFLKTISNPQELIIKIKSLFTPDDTDVDTRFASLCGITDRDGLWNKEEFSALFSTLYSFRLHPVLKEIKTIQEFVKVSEENQIDLDQLFAIITKIKPKYIGSLVKEPNTLKDFIVNLQIVKVEDITLKVRTFFVIQDIKLLLIKFKSLCETDRRIDLKIKGNSVLAIAKQVESFFNTLSLEQSESVLYSSELQTKLSSIIDVLVGDTVNPELIRNTLSDITGEKGDTPIFSTLIDDIKELFKIDLSVKSEATQRSLKIHGQGSQSPKPENDPEDSESSKSVEDTHDAGSQSPKPETHAQDSESSKSVEDTHDAGSQSPKPETHAQDSKSSKSVEDTHDAGSQSPKPENDPEDSESSKSMEDTHDAGSQSSKPETHAQDSESSKSVEDTHDAGSQSPKPETHAQDSKSSKSVEDTHDAGSQSPKPENDPEDSESSKSVDMGMDLFSDHSTESSDDDVSPNITKIKGVILNLKLKLGSELSISSESSIEELIFDGRVSKVNKVLLKFLWSNIEKNWFDAFTSNQEQIDRFLRNITSLFDSESSDPLGERFSTLYKQLKIIKRSF